MSWKNKKNIFIWLIAIIFMIAVITALKFDKFSFSLSNGKVKTEIKGEQIKNKNESSYNGISSASKTSTVNGRNNIIQINTTKGEQSPSVNSTNSTSTINYGSK